MKVKLVSIISIFAVLVSITGIAAADPDQMNIFDGSVKIDKITLPIGGSKDLTVNVSEFVRPLDTIHNLSVKLFNADGSAETTGLDVTLEETVLPLGPIPGPATCTFVGGGCNPLIRWKQSQGPGGSEVLKMKVTETAGVPTNYIIELTDKETGKSVKLSGASLAVNVPEFPAVALPVAAVIGLVFLFQHRKNKKK